MPQPTIAAQVHQSFDIHGYTGTQFTLNFVSVINSFTNLINIRLRQIIGFHIGVNANLSQNFFGCGSTDSIYVGKADFNSFAPW